jgi:hypothetical protein
LMISISEGASIPLSDLPTPGTPTTTPTLTSATSARKTQS